MNNLSYRKEITSLRAFAIIPVIFYHFDFNIFKSGYLGVDVFFVISGYLISHKIISEIKLGTFNFLNFYNKRIRRLLPALVFLILIINYLSSKIFLGSDLKTIFDSSIFSLLYLSNFYFLDNTNYFDVELETQLYLHTWSLSIEEQFYIFMPFFLYLLLTRNIKFYKQYVFVLFLVSFLLSTNLPVQYYSFKFYLLPFRLWEFLIGTLTALYLYENKTKNRFNNVKSFIFLIVLTAQFFVPYNYLDHPGLTTLTTCLSTSFLIISMNNAKKFNRVINLKIFYFIGLISYSLYLWHDPVIKINKKINYITNDLILILIIFSVSTISYYLIENYFRYKITNKKFYSMNVMAVFVIAFFIFNSSNEVSIKTAPNDLESSMEISNVIVTNTTVLSSKDMVNDEEYKKFNQKKFFEELYTDFYDKKFVDSDEINFNINSSRTGNYLENVCFITGFGYKPSAEDCLSGYSQEKTNVLFLGDSTAHNYFIGMKRFLEKENYDNFSLNVLAVTGCIPLVDDYKRGQNFTGKEEKCEYAYDEINKIINTYEFDKIFVSYRYKYFYEHKSEDFIFESSYFDFEKKLMELNDKTEVYLIGTSVLLTEDSKNFNENILLNENKIFIFSDNFLDKQVFEIDKKIRQRMYLADINYIPLLDYICEDIYCLNVLKVGNEFYRFVHDRIHLSLEASMFLAENLFLQYLTE